MTFEEYKKFFYNTRTYSNDEIEQEYNELIPYAFTSEIKTKSIQYYKCGVKWKNINIEDVNELFNITRNIKNYIDKLNNQLKKINKINKDFI